MQGKSFLPFPQPGYWGVSIRVPAVTINNQAPVENVYIELKVYEPIGSYTNTTDIPVDPPYFLACDTGRCAGQQGFACEPGYEGTQCSECMKGQFLWRSTCSTSCSDLTDTNAVTVFGISAVVLVWIFMNLNKKCAAPRSRCPVSR